MQQADQHQFSQPQLRIHKACNWIPQMYAVVHPDKRTDGNTHSIKSYQNKIQWINEILQWYCLYCINYCTIYLIYKHLTRCMWICELSCIHTERRDTMAIPHLINVIFIDIVPIHWRRSKTIVIHWKTHMNYLFIL